MEGGGRGLLLVRIAWGMYVLFGFGSVLVWGGILPAAGRVENVARALPAQGADPLHVENEPVEGVEERVGGTEGARDVGGGSRPLVLCSTSR